MQCHSAKHKNQTCCPERRPAYTVRLGSIAHYRCNLKTQQKNLDIEDSAELQTSKKESKEASDKQKEIKEAIIDGINCHNQI